MEVLPSYTPEVLPRYDLTPTTSISPSTRPSSPSSILSRARAHPNHTYRSERMELDLGTRRWGTKLPVYGRGGRVQGTVQVHSFNHVDRITVRLIGKLSTSHVVNQIPTFSQSHAIVDESIELWSHGQASSSQNSFGFEFELGRESPPSASIQLRRAQGHIAYAVRVDMYRKGMHMHETLQTEILHLPRTTTPYNRPFIPEYGNEKRPRISPAEWHTVKSETGPELLLPRDLTYPSGQTIPFILNSCTGAVDVQLVRVSTIQTRAGVVQHASTVVRGRVTSDDGHRIRGEIDTGEMEMESSWGVDKIASVSYEIRVAAPLADTTWRVTQEVTLTTHEWRGEAASRLPALGMKVTARTAMNLINMNV